MKKKTYKDNTGEERQLVVVVHVFMKPGRNDKEEEEDSKRE